MTPLKIREKKGKNYRNTESLGTLSIKKMWLRNTGSIKCTYQQAYKQQTGHPGSTETLALVGKQVLFLHKVISNLWSKVTK